MLANLKQTSSSEQTDPGIQEYCFLLKLFRCVDQATFKDLQASLLYLLIQARSSLAIERYCSTTTINRLTSMVSDRGVSAAVVS